MNELLNIRAAIVEEVKRTYARNYCEFLDGIFIIKKSDIGKSGATCYDLRYCNLYHLSDDIYKNLCRIEYIYAETARMIETYPGELDESVEDRTDKAVEEIREELLKIYKEGKKHD